ncbi:hypothetical protein KC330_g8253 [Hortaea werneckii]|nr:hypothetical protein KC330_g8253 [Hortaea werneckii]
MLLASSERGTGEVSASITEPEVESTSEEHDKTAYVDTENTDHYAEGSLPKNLKTVTIDGQAREQLTATQASEVKNEITG